MNTYSEEDLGNLDLEALQEMRGEILKEIQSRALKDIRRLEDEANDMRKAVGLRARPVLRKERPVKG